MNHSSFYRLGKPLFALSLFCIGAIHIAFKTFPAGFEPVSAALPYKTVFALVFGAVIMVSSVLIMAPKYAYRGSLLACILLAVVTFGMHLPKVLTDVKNGGLITGLFEGLALLSGAMLLTAFTEGYKRSLDVLARILFAISLIVFGILHLVYAHFVQTLIPAWIPAHEIFNYLVIFGFFASAISFIIDRFVIIAGTLLFLMFMTWFVILHIPRVAASPNIEPEWTSACIVLAMGSIALLSTSFSTKKPTR